MIKRYLTLTLTAAAILAAPAAFAASGQSRTTATATKAKVAQQAAARQAFGAAPAVTATNSTDGVAVLRPPAQPGAW